VKAAFIADASVASAYDLSVYDATYLELAERRALPLACKDGPLRKAAKRRGLPLWKS
jgi:predicted nucleic acid-binding protein